MRCCTPYHTSSPWSWKLVHRVPFCNQWFVYKRATRSVTFSQPCYCTKLGAKSPTIWTLHQFVAATQAYVQRLTPHSPRNVHHTRCSHDIAVLHFTAGHCRKHLLLFQPFRHGNMGASRALKQGNGVYSIHACNTILAALAHSMLRSSIGLPRAFVHGIRWSRAAFSSFMELFAGHLEAALRPPGDASFTLQLFCSWRRLR